MRKKKILFMIALLCAVAQGARAQNFNVWDGVTKVTPWYCDNLHSYKGRKNTIVVRSAVELAWLMENWHNNTALEGEGPNGIHRYFTPANNNIFLDVDIDMSIADWQPFDEYSGTFEGDGHTIKIRIPESVTANYQGLFKEINQNGRVTNLHVDADIHCGGSRLVGGIAGQNNGTIDNCWVSGLVQSDWKESGSAYTAKVGGICGQNNGTVQYCCVTADVKNDDADVGGLVGCNDGTLQHCTFYGERSSTHDQASIYSGNSANWENCYGVFNQGEYDAASGKDLYRYAIRYTYDIAVNTSGHGTLQVSAAGEDSVSGTSAGQTVTLTATTGTIHSVTVTDASGSNVSVATQTAGKTYTFSMPKKNVTVAVLFSYTSWPTQGQGTEGDPYLITSADDWFDFAHNVTIGRSYSGYYVKLTNNISVETMAGAYHADDNYQPFSGIFDGNNKTLTLNVSNQSRFAAPFKCVSGATIKNLRTAGTIDGTGNADGKLLAGIIGVSFGNTTITGCRSSVTLTTGFGEDAALAGFVAATKGGSLTIEGCVFDGSMTGSSNTRCAGISGYEYGGTTTIITNTLFRPATLTVSTTDDGYTKTFTRDADATITNCYYTQALGAEQGSNAISTTQAPSGIGSEVQNYGMVKAYEHGLLFDGRFYFDPANSAGTGTEGDPYIISTADQWQTFATYVNNGTDNYSGKYVMLAADISVSDMVGLRGDKPFSGTFLGGGHTLTFTKGTAESAFNEQYCAPFRYTNGATIRNLKTAGDIYTSNKFAAGIVARPNGTTNITNCHVSTVIHSSVSADGGDGTHGGFTAYPQGNVNFTGCVYTGRMFTTTGSTKCGGFVGWHNTKTYTFVNSLYAPDPNITAADNETAITTECATFVRGGSPTITNSYYTETMGTAQGTKAIALTTAPDNLGDLVEDYGIVKAYANGLLYGGKYYVPFALSGTGTAVDPYLITSTDDWNTFANSVNNGISLSGQYVKLNADISVSEMAGTSHINSFQGTFIGDGHTLTFTKGTSAEPFAEEYCAPFRHVKNAVIKNLHVDGTIYTSHKKAAGFVGISHQNLSITGCRSSININSSTITGDNDHDGTHGGFVGTLAGENNTVTIDGCVFDGSFATTNSTINCGGFIGWVTYNTPTITNSLMAPTSVASGMLANTFSRWHTTYEPAIDNCYYVATDNLPTDQGTAATGVDITPADVGIVYNDMLTVYSNGIRFDGMFYGLYAGDVTLADNSDNSTTISAADGYVANVTLANRTLYKDGAWNTICLPFNVNLNADGCPLAGATARPLTSASISGSTLNLTFGDAVTTLEAGTPYIIKWAADANYVDDDEHNIVSPVFSGVTIDADADGNYDNGVSGDERVRFLGTYKSTAFDAEDKSILLMGGENTLYYPTAGAGIGAQRAYFKIGSDGALLARRLTAFNIDFGDDETTGIISTTNYTNDTNSDAWYSLDGRRLSAKPSRAGVYINNGIKVVIK